GLVEGQGLEIAKGKDKEKEKEQELFPAANKQLVILLQHLHDAGVLEEVNLAFAQVLNKLDTAHQQRDDEVCADLSHQALGKGKHVASPPQPPHELKKDCQTEPTVPQASKPETKAPALPYSEDDVPQGNDCMDKLKEFLSSVAHGPSFTCMPKEQRALRPSKRDDKEVVMSVLVQEAGQGDEEDDGDYEYISKYKDKEIEADDNMKMCCLKKAHNKKV
ncbi:hypothetical protein C0995_011606, partial [Termitomyces sp. Mi166